MIRCAGTIYPQIHRFLTCNKVVTIRLLTYKHVLEYGFCNFVARRLAIFFMAASSPSNQSTETTKGEMCRCCWIQVSSYIFFCLCCIVKKPLPCLSHIVFFVSDNGLFYWLNVLSIRFFVLIDNVQLAPSWNKKFYSSPTSIIYSCSPR